MPNARSRVAAPAGGSGGRPTHLCPWRQVPRPRHHPFAGLFPIVMAAGLLSTQPTSPSRIAPGIAPSGLPNIHRHAPNPVARSGPRPCVSQGPGGPVRPKRHARDASRRNNRHTGSGLGGGRTPRRAACDPITCHVRRWPGQYFFRTRLAFRLIMAYHILQVRGKAQSRLHLPFRDFLISRRAYSPCKGTTLVISPGVGRRAGVGGGGNEQSHTANLVGPSSA